jgi:stress-induced morphogen
MVKSGRRASPSLARGPRCPPAGQRGPPSVMPMAFPRKDLTLPDGGTISAEALRAAHERFLPLWTDAACEGRPTGMAMAANEIEALIKAALPDAQVTVEDLAGDGDHYAAKVVSATFRGVPRVKQHQIVYAALRGRMGGELHALALQTSAPD